MRVSSSFFVLLYKRLACNVIGISCQPASEGLPYLQVYAFHHDTWHITKRGRLFPLSLCDDSFYDALGILYFQHTRCIGLHIFYVLYVSSYANDRTKDTRGNLDSQSFLPNNRGARALADAATSATSRRRAGPRRAICHSALRMIRRVSTL